jgi:hypothetical protein
VPPRIRNLRAPCVSVLSRPACPRVGAAAGASRFRAAAHPRRPCVPRLFAHDSSCFTGSVRIFARFPLPANRCAQMLDTIAEPCYNAD